MLSSKKKDLKYLSDGVAGKYVKKDTPPDLPVLNVWTAVNQQPPKKVISLTRRLSDKSSKESPRELRPVAQPTSLAQKCAKASQSQVQPISKINPQSLPSSPNIGPLQRSSPVSQPVSTVTIGAQRGVQSQLPSSSGFSGRMSSATRVDNSSRLCSSSSENYLRFNSHGQLTETEAQTQVPASNLSRFQSHIYVNHYVRNSNSENDCRVCEVDNDGVPIKTKEENHVSHRRLTVPAAVSIIEVPGNIKVEPEPPPEIAYQQDDSIQIHLYHQQIRQQYTPELHQEKVDSIHFQPQIDIANAGQLLGIIVHCF
ncbi:hypothetical protein CEXT_324991 [Caerostris extrusa]|uniref:Uncharacterized protein n=1 Tax=Caerostris extrusa TaxID=172846 RepID=A0AAV4PUW7_CAEEX|nr:hypothetical protein CEXT_324991 [Caerostris extrusa]